MVDFIPPFAASSGPRPSAMATPVVKTSFASGEWAPKLQGRVDLQKYHAGAALMRNWFVDYSGGGASTRQGTEFINQCKALGARLIPFQPSTSVSYVLEFGQNYIRFYNDGVPILETATTISGATNANPGVITDAAHGYANGDWVFISGVGGMTQLNGNYYIVQNVTTNTYTLTDLNGNAIDTTLFGVYTAGGTAARVYTLTSPYNASDLFPSPATQNQGLKFVQDVTSLIITHPSYAPQILTIAAPTSWTLTAITFGATIPAPAAPTITSTSATGGGWDYEYLVTAVDINGQESGPSAAGSITNLSYLGSTTMTNHIAWSAVPGAVSYNVYKALPSETTAIPTGSAFGFIANVTGTATNDPFPGITPDFSQTPPIPENPFVGAGVQSYTVTTAGAYTAVPTVTVAAPSNGQQATAGVSISVTSFTISHASGNNDIQTSSSTSPVGYNLGFPDGVILKITGATLTTAGPPVWIWEVTSALVISGGSITAGSIPSNPVVPTSNNIPGFSFYHSGFGLNFTWGVASVTGVNPGSGYTSAPTVTFSSGAATATATLGPASAGNPGVPGFFQERLLLAAQPQAIQGYNLSQPGSFFNFNVSNPSQDDDAISGNIISEELNDIRSLVQVPTGEILLTGKGAWLLNGGGGISTSSPITPSSQVANPQAFNGANDLKPIKINLDLLYGTNKGNYVRDLSYNIYANIYTGADISVLSNHLFFNHYLLDWAWSEEPFKTMWAIREDGIMLSLGYVKEQDLIGWAHHDTNGQYKSVCSVIETVGGGNVVDAVYFIVQRLVNGNLVQYIERMADRYFTYGYEDSWSVDCALQTSPTVSPTTTLSIAGDASAIGNVVTLTDTVGAPFLVGMVGDVVRAGGAIYTITAYTSASQVSAIVARVPTLLNPYTNAAYNVLGYTIWTPVTVISGLTQLVGQTVIGVADGAVVGPLVVSATGGVILSSAASKVTLGLQFTPDLQTLPLDLGEPTVQGKRKTIIGINLRVADTLGLSIGTKVGTIVQMKDFTLGNVGTQSNAIVTDLVSGDGRTIIDQDWQEAGNYFIRQTLPYPATVLMAVPEVEVGDDSGGRR